MTQIALSKRMSTIPPSLTRWHAGMEQRPVLAAAGVGACLGLIGALSSLLILGLALQFLPLEQWGNSAASSLEGRSLAGIFLLAVVLAPLLETILGQLLPIELARRLGAHPAMAVLLSGLLFGSGHYLNGGLVHGLTTFFSGTLFACAYVALRWLGVWPACVAAGVAHAMHNFTLIFILAPLFPGFA